VIPPSVNFKLDYPNNKRATIINNHVRRPTGCVGVLAEHPPVDGGCDAVQHGPDRLLDEGDFDRSRPVHEQRRIMREKLRTHGTDVDLNDRDLMGDGDQSPIHLDEAGKQVYRDLFAAGGDIVSEYNDFAIRRSLDTPIHKMFAFSCSSGQYELIKHHLELANSELKARKGTVDPALRYLLESRVTSMRLTPLLVIVSLGKGAEKVLPADQLRFVTENQLKVARLLLLYGARPDCRDVCGKTVIHYGSGIMATEMSMEVARWCSAAYPSSHLFGKEVILQGLNSAELNGKRGIARGFVVQSGRRVVYLIDDERELSVKPENIALADGTTVDPPRKLCDVQDRLGGTALLEVFMSNRVHIGKFLLEELQADPSVADWDGYSPEVMCMRPNSQMASGIGPMVMKAVMKRKKAELKAQLDVCAQCKVNGTTEHPLKNCAKWYVRLPLTWFCFE